MSDLHQGGVSLTEFAKHSGLLRSQVVWLAKHGRIAGATQDWISHKWTVYPPAVLLSPLQKRTTWRDKVNGGQS
jgi:hypothetical protein